MNLLQFYIVFLLVYLLYNAQTEWFATVLVINNSPEKLVKVHSYTEKESRHRHFSRIFCKMDGFFPLIIFLEDEFPKNLYDSVHSYGCGQLHPRRRKVIFKSKIFNMARLN